MIWATPSGVAEDQTWPLAWASQASGKKVDVVTTYGNRGTFFGGFGQAQVAPWLAESIVQLKPRHHAQADESVPEFEHCW